MAIKYLSKNKAQLIVSVGSASKGTRRRVTKTVEFTRKKELEKMYQRFEDEVRKNPLIGVTVDELIASYNSNAELRGLSANTLHGYRSAEKRLNSAFAGIKAKDLTTYQIDNFVSSMAKKYDPKTIANTVSLLNSAYERAVKSGQLMSNPCTGVVLPKRQKKDISTLPPEQLGLFIESLEKETPDIKAGYMLCLMCGLRRGEVLGLRESDVSTVFRQISVKRTRYIVDGKEYIQDTKTARSRRRLALPQMLADVLDELIREHHAQEWYHSDFLIQNQFGDPISPRVFSSRISKLEKAAGIDRVTVHGLRHTFATLLNAQSVDLAQISAELGHSNLSTTLNIYTHVFGDVTSSSRGIADTIDNVFNKKGAKEAQNENEKTAEA